MTTMSLTRNQIMSAWAVYEVFEPGNRTKPIFIGISPLATTFELAEAHRNSEFIRITTDTMPLTVQIVYVGDRISVANDRLNRITTTMPHCNVYGVMKDVAAVKVKCNETGIVYDNIARAAAAHDAARSAMSNHLNRKVGHKSVKGYTFSRVVT